MQNLKSILLDLGKPSNTHAFIITIIIISISFLDYAEININFIATYCNGIHDWLFLNKLKKR